MGFWAWLEGKLSTGKTVEVTADTIEQFVDQERLSNLVAEELTSSRGNQPDREQYFKV